MPLAREVNQQISEELSRLSDVKEKINKDLSVVKEKIDEAKIAIRAYVNRHFPDLIVQAEGCDMETFSAFYERNIGSEGSVLEANLQNQFEAHTGAVDLAIEKMDISLNQEINHFNSVALKWSKKVVKALSASGIDNRTILVVRNAVRSVGKQVGFKLPLKFKPYGAVKLAKGINGALAALGLALEAWELLSEYQKQKKFEEGVRELVENLKQVKNDLIAKIDSEEFILEHFPSFCILKENVDDIEKESGKMAHKRDLRQSWCKEAEKLYSEFKVLLPKS